MNKKEMDETQNINNKLRIAKNPIVLEFWRTDCSFCKAMSPIINNLIQKHKDQIEFIKINVDENTDLAVSCSVSYLPAFIFFNHGRQITSVEGARTEKVFDDKIKEMLSIKEKETT